MTHPSAHPDDALQLLLDGRLPAEQQAAVEAHLSACPRCRRELEALRGLKQMLRAADEPELPAGLSGRISASLAAESRAASRRTLRTRRAVLVTLAAAASILLVVMLTRPARTDFVAAAAEDFARLRRGALTLQLATSEPAALEQFFSGSRLGFVTRVFDFGMMGYRLTGGGIYSIGGRPSAVFSYQGPQGQQLLCRMYEGRFAELPAGGEERVNQGVTFRIFRSGDATLVFWEEGTIICVLVADGDPEAAIQLAFAKARRA